LLLTVDIVEVKQSEARSAPPPNSDNTTVSGIFDYTLLHSRDIMMSLRQSTKDITGVRTEIVFQPFADRMLLLVTQLGKVGNLVRLLGKLNRRSN
jgi:hypothetical protein